MVWPRASWLTTWVCWTNALPIFTAQAMVVLARATALVHSGVACTPPASVVTAGERACDPNE